MDRWKHLYCINNSATYPTNVTGCDSVVTLDLTINQADTSITEVTTCDSYDWNGTTYTQSGVYYSNTGSNNNYSMSFDGSPNQLIDFGQSINQSINNEMTFFFTVTPNQNAFVNGKWLFGQNEMDLTGLAVDMIMLLEEKILFLEDMLELMTLLYHFQCLMKLIHMLTHILKIIARIYIDGVEVANQACRSYQLIQVLFI